MARKTRHNHVVVLYCDVSHQLIVSHVKIFDWTMSEQKYLCSSAKREFSIRIRVVILRVVILRVVILRVRKLKGIECF